MSSPLVIVDADVLGRARTGDESYTENLLRELAALRSPLRLAAVTRCPERVPKGVEALELRARSQMVRMSVTLPALLRRLRPSVAHFHYVLPPFSPSAAVLTVHDLSFERHPQLMTARDRFLFRQLVPLSVRRAARVLVGSEWTRRDLVERYRVPADKIVVTPYGVDPAFGLNGPVAPGPPYALFVGALQPRKDPFSALEALALVDSGLRLVFAGPEKRSGRDVRTAVARLGLERRVDFLGHVAKDDLAALYRGAACLVFPSRYEGFGLPVLEAMACGTPVVATTAGALPETAGDAAILVPPGDIEALARGIEQALAERDRLRAAGVARARRFSWAATARATLAVYEELV